MDDVTLTKRVCALLGRVPGWAWRETGPAYTASEVGIFYGPIGDAPDRAIGVRIYAAQDDPFLLQRRVQLHIRGGPRRVDGADELAAVAFTVLHGLCRESGISETTRLSIAPLGADGNGRQTRTDNYLIILDNLEVSS